MPGPWKPWKTRQRFPTAPTAPWKSHTPRFPPSHSADGFPLSSQEKQTPRPSRSSDAQGKNQTAERRPLAASASAANRPLFQAHSALERKPLFRLIARWNQFSISGSFVDWNTYIRHHLHAYLKRAKALITRKDSVGYLKSDGGRSARITPRCTCNCLASTSAWGTSRTHARKRISR